MTYPHPSKSYKELLCTAGITESGDWVRLYPIDYRYRPANQRFRKYQWIEVGLTLHGGGNDNRKESRQPDLSSIRLLGEPLGTKDSWRERRNIIDRLPVHTKNELHDLYERERISLGVIAPTRFEDVRVEKNNESWTPVQQGVLDQFSLFEGRPKRLEKLPFKWSYRFTCADSAKPHSAAILDWELGALFLKERERLGSESEAVESVRQKYLELCSPKLETKLFMGTIFPRNTWVCIGVWRPPKIKPSFQQELDF